MPRLFFVSLVDRRHVILTVTSLPQSLFYFYRANQAQRPACIGIHMGGRGNKWSSLIDLEERGMTTLFGPDDLDLSVLLPDSEGQTTEQLAAMPEFIRAFRCGNVWEKVSWNASIFCLATAVRTNLTLYCLPYTQGSVCSTEKWTHFGGVSSRYSYTRELQ
jgi:hypothetical protein